LEKYCLEEIPSRIDGELTAGIKGDRRKLSGTPGLDFDRNNINEWISLPDQH